MEILEVIKKRRSVRRFKNTPVTRETVARLLEAARWAPTAGNVQPWYFYVVYNPELKVGLAAAALGQGFLAEAPVCIVICADPESAARIYGERGRSLYCLQDTAAAAENIILAATAEGLGTCWVGAFDEERVRAVLGIPRHLRPVIMIPVGYPQQEEVQRTSRREIAEISRIIE